jgi:hypothetical protein
MARTGVPVRVSPRASACRATVFWDPEVLLLEARLADPDAGPEAPGYRVVLGDLDLVFRGPCRLESLEARTAPHEWQRRPLPPLPAETPPACVELLVPFDPNRIFSRRLALTVVHDAGRRELAFQLPGPAATAWYALADVGAGGVTAECVLAEQRQLDRPDDWV